MGYRLRIISPTEKGFEVLNPKIYKWILLGNRSFIMINLR